MRAFTTGTFSTAFLLVCLLGGAALAEPGKKPPKVDTSAYRSDMVVLHDGAGHYLVSVPVAEHYTTLFYGDGKTFYKQRTFGGGLDLGNQSSSAHFWEPRVDHRASVEQVKGAWHVQCGTRKTSLTPLPAEEATKLIDKAVFLEPLWQYGAHALARDDRGNYYYVDRLRDELGGKGFRLWMGPKGAMKRMKMTNIVSDSMGDIFATRRGELRFILSKNSSTWVSGKKHQELVNVPVRENVRLIYAELGVYLGELGTPCDHL